MAVSENPAILRYTRIRKSPYFYASREHGVARYNVYNHTYHPRHYGDPVAEYWHLLNHSRGLAHLGHLRAWSMARFDPGRHSGDFTDEVDGSGLDPRRSDRSCVRGPAPGREPPPPDEEPRSVSVPETRYAKTADGVHVAYQVVGDGPIDFLFVLGWVTHIERMWIEPRIERFLQRLASFSRVMLFDKRGVGLSDRVPADRLPSLEVRMDDARAVMDAVGSERAVVLGHSEGGPMAALFAATYPERAIALVLFGTSLCWNGAPDYPWGSRYGTEEEMTQLLEEREQRWGTKQYAAEMLAESLAPSEASNEQTVTWFADYMRNAASPGAANAFAWMNRGIDVRSALPAIHVPTLVLARDDDLDFPMEETKWIADRIRGARFVSFPGNDHYIFMGRQDDLLDEIERFVAEVRGQEADLDRVLATVLFTDIVSSTEKAAELGDRGWRDLVERHHGVVRAMLGRFRGAEVDTAGDGFFATFDGPARGVRCAQAISDAVRDLGIEVRAGVHTGEVETIAGKVGGIAVNVGARIASLAAPSEVLVSHTVQGLVSGSGLTFEDIGEHKLKGVPEPWHLFRLASAGS